MNMIRARAGHFTRYQEYPGNAYSEALPRILIERKRGRASGHRFSGISWEPVNRFYISNMAICVGEPTSKSSVPTQRNSTRQPNRWATPFAQV